MRFCAPVERPPGRSAAIRSSRPTRSSHPTAALRPSRREIRPKRKGANDAFRFQGREIKIARLNGKWSSVRLPKIGWVKFRRSREIPGKVKNVTVSRNALGWHLAFSVEIAHGCGPSVLPSAGIDRGVSVAVATSDGELHRMPERLKVLDRRHRKVQKVVSRGRHAVWSCYDVARKQQPALEGRVMVSWMIGPKGRVKVSRVTSSTAKNAKLEECLVETVRGWTFPQPKGGGVVEVNYPWVFSAM